MDPADPATWFCFSRLPGRYLKGCVGTTGCTSFTSLREAKKQCNLESGCSGIVESGDAAARYRYQLRGGTVPEASTKGEVAYVKHGC